MILFISTHTCLVFKRCDCMSFKAFWALPLFCIPGKQGNLVYPRLRYAPKPIWFFYIFQVKYKGSFQVYLEVQQGCWTYIKHYSAAKDIRCKNLTRIFLWNHKIMAPCHVCEKLGRLNYAQFIQQCSSRFTR